MILNYMKEQKVILHYHKNYLKYLVYKYYFNSINAFDSYVVLSTIFVRNSVLVSSIVEILNLSCKSSITVKSF